MKSQIRATTTADLNRAINCCIQIEKIRISHVTVPHGVNFQLNADLLRQIGQSRDNKQQLLLPAAVLADLRYYALINVPLEQLRLSSSWGGMTNRFGRSLLTFSTNYSFSNSQRTLTFFRSSINLEGKISQQIHQDLWQNPQLLAQISQAHYWLIGEILAQLPLESKHKYSWLVFTSLITIVILSGLIINYFFSLSLLLNLVIGFSLFLLLNIGLKKTVIEQINSLIIYQMIDGLLSRSTLIRQLARQILQFTI